VRFSIFPDDGVFGERFADSRSDLDPAELARRAVAALERVAP
jgi:hypothetical protein